MALGRLAVAGALVSTCLLAGCVQNQQQPVTTYRVGSASYASEGAALAEVRYQDDAAVAQVGQSAQRLGGTLQLVLPSPAAIRATVVSVSAGQLATTVEYRIHAGEIYLTDMGRAVESGKIFDVVRTVRADDPASVDPGDADYKLWLDRYGAPTNKWTLLKRGGEKHDLVVLPGNVARVAWLNGLNVAILNAAADLGAPVARQPVAANNFVTGPSSGTVFFIDAAGHALTNAHVAGNCKTIKIAVGGGKTAEATLVAKDTQNDLALLAVTPAQPVFGQFSAAPPRQGEEVAAYGFPLAGALSTQGNLSTGIVSALVGLGDDSRMLQISAPVQPSNSGGPLLDLGGNVIGVVSSKINALKVAAITGDIPQNVNFAIKSSVVFNFLETNGVNLAKSPARKATSIAEVSDKAKGFTFMVLCER